MVRIFRKTRCNRQFICSYGAWHSRNENKTTHHPRNNIARRLEHRLPQHAPIIHRCRKKYASKSPNARCASVPLANIVVRTTRNNKALCKKQKEKKLPTYDNATQSSATITSNTIAHSSFETHNNTRHTYINRIVSLPSITTRTDTILRRRYVRLCCIIADSTKSQKCGCSSNEFILSGSFQMG
jgi:hypothetical protein